MVPLTRGLEGYIGFVFRSSYSEMGNRLIVWASTTPISSQRRSEQMEPPNADRWSLMHAIPTLNQVSRIKQTASDLRPACMRMLHQSTSFGAYGTISQVNTVEKPSQEYFSYVSVLHILPAVLAR